MNLTTDELSNVFLACSSEFLGCDGLFYGWFWLWWLIAGFQEVAEAFGQWHQCAARMFDPKVTQLFDSMLLLFQPALVFFPMLIVCAYTRGKLVNCTLWFVNMCVSLVSCFFFGISLRSGRLVQVFQLLPVVCQDLSIVQLQGSTEGGTEFKMFMTFIQIIKSNYRALKYLKPTTVDVGSYWNILKSQIAVLRVPHFLTEPFYSPSFSSRDRGRNMFNGSAGMNLSLP